MLVVVAKAAVCPDVLICIHLSSHYTNAALSLYPTSESRVEWLKVYRTIDPNCMQQNACVHPGYWFEIKISNCCHPLLHVFQHKSAKCLLQEEPEVLEKENNPWLGNQQRGIKACFVACAPFVFLGFWQYHMTNRLYCFEVKLDLIVHDCSSGLLLNVSNQTIMQSKMNPTSLYTNPKFILLCTISED